MNYFFVPEMKYVIGGTVYPGNVRSGKQSSREISFGKCSLDTNLNPVLLLVLF